MWLDGKVVHPEFKGSASVKYVLPALVPDLQYKGLSIHGNPSLGGVVGDGPAHASEREMIAKNLKEYCGLDTYAMYAIWKHLHELAQSGDGKTLVPLLRAA
jgi:hypothetical protein